MNINQLTYAMQIGFISNLRSPLWYKSVCCEYSKRKEDRVCVSMYKQFSRNFILFCFAMFWCLIFSFYSAPIYKSNNLNLQNSLHSLCEVLFFPLFSPIFLICNLCLFSGFNFIQIHQNKSFSFVWFNQFFYCIFMFSFNPASILLFVYSYSLIH